MRKTYILEELDCAHCAASMEQGIRKLEGVIDVSVNFLTQRLTLEAADDDFKRILKQAQKVCRRIEPDCRILTGDDA